MKRRTPLQVYLDAGDRALLDALARRLGRSRAEVLREAVRRWSLELSGEEDALLKLIGSVDDPALPTDLSTRHDEYAADGYPVRRVAEPPAGGRGAV